MLVAVLAGSGQVSASGGGAVAVAPTGEQEQDGHDEDEAGHEASITLVPLDRNGSASAEERQTAVNLAKSVHGVTGVVDRMTLSR
mgnify:FL=1